MTTELLQWRGLQWQISYRKVSCIGPKTSIQRKNTPLSSISTKLYQIDYMNLYLRPEAAKGQMNIPWFVSNGYLVFTPDIHYKIGFPGESAFNSIVSCSPNSYQKCHGGFYPDGYSRRHKFGGI